MIKVSLIPNDFTMEFEKVMKLCQEENVKYVELAYMWNKSVLDLNESELSKVHELMDSAGVKAASIQTQIMKVHLPESKLAAPNSKNMHRDYEYNKSRIADAVRMAKEFNCKYIVTYSYFTYLVGKKEENWQRLFNDYQELLKPVAEAGKQMVVECEGDTYIGSVDEYLRLFQRVKSESLKANFDLCNLYSHVHKFDEHDAERMKPYVEYFHVKDRKKVFLLGSKPAVFGTGSVPWRMALKKFYEMGFDGVLSVEPHVHGKNRFELGRMCVKNLQALLKELNIPFI